MKLRHALTGLACALPLTASAMEFKPLSKPAVVHRSLLDSLEFSQLTPMEFESLPTADDFFNGGLEPELELNPALLPRKYKVTMYSSPNCGYCKIGKEAIEKNFPDCELVKLDDANDHPTWARNMGGVPIFHWQEADGQWRYYQGWMGVDKFETMVMKNVRADLFEEIPGDAQPTAWADVRKVVDAAPLTKDKTFIDYGCGYDARFCILASLKYGCKSIGIEYNAERAALAQKHVEAAGLEDLVTIIHGDATEVDVEGDVAVAYLFPEALNKLKPKLEQLEWFASLQHPVEGLRMRAEGNAHIWSRTNSEPQQQNTSGWVRPYAIYGNPPKKYYGRVCNRRNCGMCNKIAHDIANFKQPNPNARPPQPKYETRAKYCNGKFCGWIRVRVQ